VAALSLAHTRTRTIGRTPMPALLMWLMGVPIIVIILLYLIF
jgi:hypothetical protein